MNNLSFLPYTLLICIIAISCNSSQQHYLAGIKYYEEANYAKAIEAFSKVLKADPSNVKAREFRGSSFINLGLYEKGLEDMQIVAKDAQNSLNNPSLYNNIGHALSKSGRDSLAIKYFKLALIADPFEPTTYQNLAVSYSGIGEYETAISYLNKLIELSPNTAVPYYLRAVVYFFDSQNESALRDMNSAILLDSTDHVFYLKRASIYGELERYEEALKDLEKSLYLEDSEPETYEVKAIIYEHLELTDSVCAAVNKFYQLNPNYEIHLNTVCD